MLKVLIALAGLALAGTAGAAIPVTIKADASDADGVVTLGEIFDGAGKAGQTPVASRTGQTVMLNASLVRAAAARAGLDWANAEGLRQIVVRSGASAASPAGRANVDVLTWTRSVAVGEIIQPQDVIWGKAALAPPGAPADPDRVVGLAARRTLRAGAAVGSSDVTAPQVIKANDIVTLLFEDSGISLSLQAKALGAGAVGETISVQNTSSRKTIQAVVTGPGSAIVGPAAEQFRLTHTTRFAAR